MAEKGEYQTRTAVFWNKREGNSLIKEQTVWFWFWFLHLFSSCQNWTQTRFVAWSPKGSFLASFHPHLGVALWGGVSMTRCVA
jgi:hypothetical protein